MRIKIYRFLDILFQNIISLPKFTKSFVLTDSYFFSLLSENVINKSELTASSL